MLMLASLEILQESKLHSVNSQMPTILCTLFFLARKIQPKGPVFYYRRPKNKCLLKTLTIK